MNTVNYSNRVYGLDVFRAIAILIVVQAHGRIVAKNLFSDWPSIPLIDGVELFFVLSGFLIGGILIRTIEKENGFKFNSLTVFWKRRWFRTLPNYYLILLVNYFFVKYGVIAGKLDQFNYKFFLFFQNFSEGFVDFFWESWSLSIEEWFYISLPLFLIVLLRFLNQKQAILLTVVLLILIPLAYRISIVDVQVDRFWLDVNFRKVVLTRLDAIIYGVLAAYVKFYHPNFWVKSKNWLFILGLAIIYINIFIPKEPNDFYTKTLSFSITSIGAMLLLAKADSVKSFKYSFIGKSITHISLISYSMYLINLSVVAQVIDKNFPPETTVEKVLMYLIYWVLVIVLSTIIYRFFEKPIMHLRDKI